MSAAEIWVKELKVTPDVANLIAGYKFNPPIPVRDKEKVLLDHQSEWLVEQKILKTKVNLSRRDNRLRRGQGELTFLQGERS